ncbi:MAG: NAD-dependent epimerase/dehydratase family protein [Actinomycetota bacterium]
MRVVVTGGAGFIGSHLVDALVARGDEVVVVDDLSTGFRANVPPEADLRIGPVTDLALMRDACAGAAVVFHQAAAKAVLRSVEQPLDTDHVNTHGTLTALVAAHEAGVRRFVHASSSSIYGGAATRPTPENVPLAPRSPYAVSKLAAEHYCRVFHELHGLETVALRYFNVFGPRQPPDAAYAAVIPLFAAALLAGEAPVIHGDGLQSRDFTYVSDIVDANLAAAAAPAARCAGRALNVAGGHAHSLLDLIAALEEVIGRGTAPVFTPTRAGDIRHSCADASAAAVALDFRCRVDLVTGLRRTVEWMRDRGPGPDRSATLAP